MEIDEATTVGEDAIVSGADHMLHGSVHDAGRHGVNPDPSVCLLGGQGLRDAIHRRLGRRICRSPVLPDASCSARDIDYHSSSASEPSAFVHEHA